MVGTVRWATRVLRLLSFEPALTILLSERFEGNPGVVGGHLQLVKSHAGFRARRQRPPALYAGHHPETVMLRAHIAAKWAHPPSDVLIPREDV